MKVSLSHILFGGFLHKKVSGSSCQTFFQGWSLAWIQSSEAGRVLCEPRRSIILQISANLSRFDLCFLFKAKLLSCFAVGCITAPWYGMGQLVQAERWQSSQMCRHD